MPSAGGPAGTPAIRVATTVPEHQADVVLTGTGFQMGGSLVPGPIRFRVRNVSSGRHSFAIDSGTRKFELEDPLEPGQSGVLDVELAGGAFRVFCPLRGHTESPRLLAVTPRAVRP